ncbi:unnamed protein product [Brassicogethes aeneus]|uniref:Uncharacterized protein n=1 Tax=Brassicogethes aeneus TaxID=1431903 RepID=A0A9P0AQD0_BRAAE|nr:unnamed protein product [Brassicogethes aeneus]
MKIYILLACLAVAVSANTQNQWKHFKQTHQKSYRSLIEERLRYQIFSANLEKIEQHNVKFEQGLTTYKQGINQFSDWTEKEFLAFLTLSVPPEKIQSDKFFESNETIPSEIDWRTKGAVLNWVKNQGACGSCWAFSVAGTLESHNQIKNGKLISLSEQNLLDCSTSYGNGGCGGGHMSSAFNYVTDHGIMSLEDYPYDWVQKECRYNQSKVVVNSKGVVFINPNSEEDLLKAVGTVGPVSIGFHSTGNLQSYSSGIFTDSTCTKTIMNHGLVVVGYGTEGETDYWIVRNSWSGDWGEKGYFRVVRGSNMCGVATSGIYPLL